MSYTLRRFVWWVFSRARNKGRLLRDTVGLMGVVVFVGPNGSGKSLLAVECVLDEIGVPWECDDLDHSHNRPVRAHVSWCMACSCTPGHEVRCQDALDLLAVYGHGLRQAWSTLPLLDPVAGGLHPHYRPLTSLRQLQHIEHAVVLLDEVEEAAGSDQSASMPGVLKRWLKQLRKRDVFLFVTTPGYDSCAKPIRQIAKLVVDCRSFFSVPSTSGRRWRPRLAMVFEAYDAFEFGSFDKASGKRLPSLAREFYWRDSNPGQHGYNTLAQVHGLSEVDDTGNCVVCNGGRTRHRCACAADVHEIHPDELVVIEVDGPKGGKARKGVRRAELDGSGGVPPGVPLPAGPHDDALRTGELEAVNTG